MMQDWFISPDLYTVLAVGAFLSTPLMLVSGLVWDWLNHTTGQWSLGWAYLAGFLLGCVAGIGWLMFDGPATGDPNPFSLIVWWWLGVCVVMAPVTLVFIAAFLGVFVTFFVLMGLVMFTAVYWWAALPFTILLAIGWAVLMMFRDRFMSLRSRP